MTYIVLTHIFSKLPRDDIDDVSSFGISKIKEGICGYIHL